MDKENPRVINFINGDCKRISQEMANILSDKLTKGCGDFEFFMDENGDTFLMIQMLQINYIE